MLKIKTLHHNCYLITDFPEHTSKKVVGFTDICIGGKLMAMGLFIGAEIKYVRKAPLGGNYYFKVDNGSGSFNTGIALRPNEAKCIIVE